MGRVYFDSNTIGKKWNEITVLSQIRQAFYCMGETVTFLSQALFA